MRASLGELGEFARGKHRLVFGSVGESLKFEQWVKNATDQASKDGFNSTPTVLVDGEQVQGGTIPELVANTQEAIQAALAG